MQIIEASREYVPARTALELMERGEAIPAASGRRWRDTEARQAHERAMARQEVERLAAEGSDSQSAAALADRARAEIIARAVPVASPGDVDVNALAAMAAAEEPA